MAYEETPDRPDSTGSDDDDLLKLALERFKQSSSAESKLRDKFLDDLRFYSGDQWPENIKEARNADDRPCLTINRLPQFVHQVSNDVRRNKPAPKVSPVEESDIETAEIIQGIYRYIERQSLADAVRSYAAFYQIVTGRGYYRLLTEYLNPMSKDQDILIKRIKNPATVYIDPTAQEQDFSDAKWAFIVEDLTLKQFKAAYPNAKTEGGEFDHGIGDDAPEWANENSVRVAEYFYRELEAVQVAVLGDGSIVPLDQVPPGQPIIEILNREVPRVYWAKITCYEVLDSEPWPGQWIPIITFLGEEYDVNGKTEMVGMVRNAKDPQKMLNYWESCKTETIALAPRSPYIAAEGQLEGHEHEWANANKKNYAVLHYRPKSLDGTLVPPPQRQAFEPATQAITAAEAGAVEHLKATTGIFDASLGNRSNETSGLAIRQRQIEGDTANFHFIDNMRVGITHEARMIIDLIPKIYKRPGRVMRIIGDDGSERSVKLNQPFVEQGAMKVYDLNVGRYDVAVDIGPTQQTKRQEAVDAMLGFAQAAPGLLPQYADLFVSAMDWPLANEIADRIRPPNIPPKGQPKESPQALQKINELQAQNDQLMAALKETTDILQGKQAELASKERMQTEELESKERIAAQNNQVTLVSKAADVDAKASIALLAAEIKSISDRLNMLQADQPVEEEPRGKVIEGRATAVSDADRPALTAPTAFNPDQAIENGPVNGVDQESVRSALGARPPLDSFLTED